MSRASRLRLAGAALAALSLSGCASVTDRVSDLWPFGREAAAADRTRDPDLIPVLGMEEALTPSADMAAVAVSVPASAPLPSWPSPGGVATNAPGNIAGDGALSVAWSRRIGAGASRYGALIAPPIVADGRLYTLDANLVVHASDAITGAAVWREGVGRPLRRGWFREEQVALGGGIAHDSGRVFVTTGYGEMVALDAATGAEIWRTATASPIHSAPLAAAGRVFVVSTDSELFAFDQATGVVQWTAPAIAEPARMLAASSPALVGDTLVTPFASGELTASLAANGRRLWAEGLTREGAGTSLSAINDIAGRPVIAGGLVIAASQSGVLAAIDLRTGTRIWEQPMSSIQTPWVAGDFVYAVSTDAMLVCVNRADGRIKWLRQLPRYHNARARTGRISWTGPVMVEGQLVLGSSRGVVAVVDPVSGEIRSETSIGGELFIPPAVANGTVYFYASNAEVTALR